MIAVRSPIRGAGLRTMRDMNPYRVAVVRAPNDAIYVRLRLSGLNAIMFGDHWRFPQRP